MFCPLWNCELISSTINTLQSLIFFISQKVETWKLASLDVEWLLSFLAERYERNHSHPRRSTWEPNRCQVLKNGFHRAYSPLQAECVDVYYMKQTVEDLCLCQFWWNWSPGLWIASSLVHMARSLARQRTWSLEYCECLQVHKVYVI